MVYADSQFLLFRGNNCSFSLRKHGASRSGWVRLAEGAGEPRCGVAGESTGTDSRCELLKLGPKTRRGPSGGVGVGLGGSARVPRGEVEGIPVVRGRERLRVLTKNGSGFKEG